MNLPFSPPVPGVLYNSIQFLLWHNIIEAGLCQMCWKIYVQYEKDMLYGDYMI